MLFDQNGSTVYASLTDTVRDLVNNSGQIVNHFVYDAFGNRRSETNPQGGAVPFSPQMGFTGQWFDAVTALELSACLENCWRNRTVPLQSCSDARSAGPSYWPVCSSCNWVRFRLPPGRSRGRSWPNKSIFARWLRS